MAYHVIFFLFERALHINFSSQTQKGDLSLFKDLDRQYTSNLQSGSPCEWESIPTSRLIVSMWSEMALPPDQ